MAYCFGNKTKGTKGGKAAANNGGQTESSKDASGKQPVLKVGSLVPSGRTYLSWKHQNELFVQRNRSKSGVVALASGLQYEVIKKGESDHHREQNANPEVIVAASLCDGTKIEEQSHSWMCALEQCFPGHKEILTMMGEGDFCRVVAPSKLAAKLASGKNCHNVPSKTEMKSEVLQWLSDKRNDTAWSVLHLEKNKRPYQRVLDEFMGGNIEEAWDLTCTIPPNSALLLEFRVASPEHTK